MNNYIYRDNCRCGWQSSWASNQAFARRMGDLHHEENNNSIEHTTFISYGEYSKVVPGSTLKNIVKVQDEKERS